MTDTPVRAGIYTRISLAAIGDSTKTDDQERICRDLATRLGWPVIDVYCDHAKSAWRKDRKRKHWDRMLADVDTGRINAIIVYHGDRLVRRPEDLADLIRLADSKGVKLASPTGTKNLDTERLELWIRAAFAEEESQRTSERRKSQYERWRREGKVRPGGRGGRAFGFEMDGKILPRNQCVLATRELTGEPDLVREMAARVLAGETVGSIARDVNARGWRTPAGGEFSHATIRKMLARPRYAGLMPDGIHPAAWEPILDWDTWQKVCEVLEQKAEGFAYTTNARRYLLSGIAVCGPCGAPLQIRGEGFRAHFDGKQCVKAMCTLEHRWQSAPHLTGYGCVAKGCRRRVQRNMLLLDEYVITRVLAKLGDPGSPAGNLPAPPDRAGEFRALMKQRGEVEERLADPAYPHLAVMEQRLAGIDARLEQLREEARGGARARLLRDHASLTREEWDALPLATRRALVAACYTVRVLPASRRGPGFNSDDVQLSPPGRK